MTRISFYILRWGVWAIVTCAFPAAGQTNQSGAAMVPDLTAPADGRSPDMSGLLSLSVSAEKVRAYPGEAVPLIIKLTYAENLAVRDIQFPRIPHAGVSLRDTGPPVQGTEQGNGASWTTQEFRYLVSGEKAGTFILGPVTLDCTLFIPSASNGPQGFFGGSEPHSQHLKADGMKVTIVPFPREGRPVGFRGAVGDFRLAATVKPREVRAGDPVTVTTTISGDGTMETVACPSVDAGAAFRVHEPQARRSKGQTDCEQILIPADETVRQIPPVSFSYFDPLQGSYRTLKKGPFPVRVIGPAAQQPLSTSAHPPSSMTSGSGTSHQDNVRRRMDYMTYVPVGAGMVLLVLAGFSLRRYRKRTTESFAVGEHPALPHDTRPEPDFVMVKGRLAEGDSGQFHTAVFKALQRCLGTHCRREPQAITADILDTHLRPGGLSDTMIVVAQSLFAECDRTRYGGEPACQDDMEATYQRLMELADYLEAVRRVRDRQP